MKVSLLTGGDDPSYAIPLAEALAERGVHVDFIGNDHMERSSRLRRANITYLNLRGDQDARAALPSKAARILRYYRNLIRYARRSDSRLFHVLWLNKWEAFDRTLLTWFYKISGKKLVFTAHNVNARRRDGNDTWLNTASLKAMYAMLDHIFVHTRQSRDELVRDYGVHAGRVSVIPFGLNTYVPETPLCKAEARERLGVGETERTLLFFGQIAPYKGLDVLLEAERILSADQYEVRLLVAGRAKAGCESYWQPLKSGLERHGARARVTVMDRFIADEDVAVLFRAADALVLPYRAIYQSGPLSLAQRFGVPVIATRVGAFAEDVADDVNGFLCEPDNPADLAKAIRRYFDSDLHREGEATQKRLREAALERHSWEGISRRIAEVYADLDGRGV